MSWKDTLVDAVIVEVQLRRNAGQSLSDEQILAAHGELQPELNDALSLLHAIERAQAKVSSAAVKPIRVLTDEELDLPIDVCQTDDCAPPSQAITIEGYIVTREIDRGGQASVVEAMQRSTGRRVAVKVLAGGRFASDRARARFHREASILARLDHQGIVCILDRGQTHEGYLYIVMPLVDGPTLGQCLAEEPLSLRGIFSLYARICRAVEAAHGLGIVHRDLKPSNVRIDRHGHPRVLDFGMAQLLDHAAAGETITAERHVVGSMHYSSPEQIMGKRDLDGRSDIYSLGLMLYESVAGRPPFGADLPMHELIRHTLTVAPDRPSRHRKRRDPDDANADRIVARCLAKSREHRYGSAAALADDLEFAAEGRSLKRQPTASFKVSTMGSLAIVLTIALGTLAMALRAGSSNSSMQRTAALPTFRNSVGLMMLRVPSGPMLIKGYGATSLAQPFWLSSTEVTSAAFRSVMPLADPKPSADLPMNDVSWIDATEFCLRLSAREHRRYRLPTVTEWEYACRASARLVVISGPELNQYAWTSANAGGHPHAAGTLKPNAWGFFDMLGNVGEWCQGDGRGLTAPVAGGSFHSPPSSCNPGTAHFRCRQSASVDVGFRIAADNS